ncbi:MAG: hypothetical protein IPO58_18255 [Betaproteobacteria bacterium]|nr:hypothetical protein [Betaproteobacteria bacterium]
MSKVETDAVGWVERSDTHRWWVERSDTHLVDVAGIDFPARNRVAAISARFSPNPTMGIAALHPSYE